jgi:signal transduction histidine kinase
MSDFDSCDLNKNALQTVEAVGKIGRFVAHDLNNMVSGIVGYTELLSLRVEKGSKDEKYLKLIQAAVERASKLIEVMLMLSPNRDVPETRIDLNLMFKNIELFISHIGGGVDVSLCLNASKALITGREQRLLAAFLNLCINAAEAIQGAGKIVIFTSNPDANSILIEISDSGNGFEGISEEDASELFSTTKDESIGTGLGLPCAINTIREHAGDFSINSAPGEGTTISIKLPLS